MEGTYVIRLGGILALFLGSLYILMPTILQEDAASRLESQASAVSTGEGKASMEVLLETGADAQSAASALEARLKASGIATDRVRVTDGRVEVLPGVGTSRDDIVDAASAVGAVWVYDPATLTFDAPSSEVAFDASKLPEDVVAGLNDLSVDIDLWGPVLLDHAMQPVPASAGALPLVPMETDGKLVLQGEAMIPDDPGFLAVGADGLLGGLLFPGSDGWSLALLHPADGEPMADLSAYIRSGPIPEFTVVEVDDAAEDGAEEGEAEVAKSSAPAWLLGMLPNTRMNLGLDLQGGIDMTLDVDLEEAALSQAQRDTVYIKERAAREGLNIIRVHRAPEEPVILVQTDDPLDQLTEFFRKWGPDYAYGYTDGNTHAFEMAEERIKEVGDNAVEQVLETLRKRVDATGVKEPSIVKKGGGKINVQLPGEVDLQSAIDAIGTTAVLEFRLVHEEFDESILEKHLVAAEREMPEAQYNDDTLLNRWLWETKRLKDEEMVMWKYDERADGTKVRSYPVPLHSEVNLTGNDINNASVAFDQNSQPYVRLEFKPRGGQVFCDISSNNINKRFAIILDDEIVSTPVFRDRICGGVGSIEMGASVDPVQEANNLALVLRTGSLDAPVNIGDLRTVGSLLGEDAIRSGSIASMVGASIVLLFMGIWYGKAGLIADVALILNILLAFAVLSLFGATLTLPGIAGIALTAGMAVDANIIIYERIREELATGVMARKAVDIGFEKGVVAVLDANVTTAIAGIVLFSYGTGPIKGFAVTLLIGILTTLVTALFVTRTFMDLLTRSSTAVLRL